MATSESSGQDSNAKLFPQLQDDVIKQLFRISSDDRAQYHELLARLDIIKALKEYLLVLLLGWKMPCLVGGKASYRACRNRPPEPRSV